MPPRLTPLALAGLLLTTCLLGGVSAPQGPAYAGPARGRTAGLDALPVLARDFPDPTVVRFAGRLVAVGTGPGAPRATAPTAAGPWRPAGRALATVPRWARRDSIWASDLVPGRHGWLLYFSALVRGLGPDGRCIGVATAPTPLGSFTPGKRPLVCPRAARGPTGSDPVVARGLATPAGVIDPDGYTSRSGRRFLTYRTQGLPATIRIVRLDRTGTRARHGSIGAPLVASTGVVENPELLKRGRTWVLLTSEGYYGGCGYRTTYRRSPTLAGLGLAPRETLLQRRRNGLCGPGGAALVGRTMFFHAWTCPAVRPHCRAGRDYHRRQAKLGAARSLFAATLRWNRDGQPRIASYVVPVRPPDVVNATDQVELPPGTPGTPATPEPDDPGEPTQDPLGGLIGILLPGLDLP